MAEPAVAGMSEDDQARLAELEKIIGGETGCSKMQQCVEDWPASLISAFDGWAGFTKSSPMAHLLD